MSISRYNPGYGKIDYLKEVWESELTDIIGGLEDLAANLAFDLMGVIDFHARVMAMLCMLVKDLRVILERESVFGGGEEMNSMEQIAALPVGAVFRSVTADEDWPELPYRYTKTSETDLEFGGLFAIVDRVQSTIEEIFGGLDEEIEEVK